MKNIKKGLICPRCGCRDLRPWKVINISHQSGFIRRYRVCRHCGHIIRTREFIDKKETK